MMPKFPSRPQRWMKAVSEAQANLEIIREAEEDDDTSEAKAALESAIDDLVSLKEEYQEWRDNMPESMESSPTVEKLEEVLYLDLESAQGYMSDDDFVESLDDIESILDEAENVDLPRGFGRD